MGAAPPQPQSRQHLSGKEAPYGTVALILLLVSIGGRRAQVARLQCALLVDTQLKTVCADVVVDSSQRSENHHTCYRRSIEIGRARSSHAALEQRRHCCCLALHALLHLLAE